MIYPTPKLLKIFAIVKEVGHGFSFLKQSTSFAFQCLKLFAKAEMASNNFYVKKKSAVKIRFQKNLNFKSFFLLSTVPVLEKNHP
jgi:hypothetical protein